MVMDQGKEESLSRLHGTPGTSDLGPDTVDTAELTSNRFIPTPALAASRYNRQLLIPSISLQGQESIASTKVLIIGLGGLGSPASLYLAGAGVHTLGLLDHDVVEESNLHRQIVHRESSIYIDGGRSTSSATLTKAQSALRGCRDLNSSINYQVHEVRLDASNALSIVERYDIVLDCTDNPATRYLISDVCVVLGKVLVSGAAQKLDGQLMILNYIVPADESRTTDANAIRDTTEVPIFQELKASSTKAMKRTERGPCYRCVFPIPPAPDLVRGCSEIGILGPVVGTIGCLMASETLRVICRPDEVRKPSMLLYSAWSPDPRGVFRSIGLRGARPDCVACGPIEAIQQKGKQKIDRQSLEQGLTDYEAFCGRIEDVHILKAKERVSAEAFLKRIGEEKDAIVVDVREHIEVELGPKISGSINIPISTINRGSVATSNKSDSGLTTTNAVDLIDMGQSKGPVYFVCQRGNDSQIAAKKYLDRLVAKQDTKRWAGDVEGGFNAIEKLVRND